MKKRGNIQMVFGALRCMNNVDFEKISKQQHCSRCVYYMTLFAMT